MKPYDEFEAKVKELITLIDEPITLIDYKVKSSKRSESMNVKEEILLAYEEIVPEELKDYIPLERIYGKKWTNAGTKMKDIREELTGKVAITNADITAIKAMRSEKEETAQLLYGKTTIWHQQLSTLVIMKFRKQRSLREKKQKKLPEEKENWKLKKNASVLKNVEEFSKKRKSKEKRRKKLLKKLKEVDEEQARFLSSEESKKVIYTVVATEEELKDIEQAMTSFGVYFERKDV